MAQKLEYAGWALIRIGRVRPYSFYSLIFSIWYIILRPKLIKVVLYSEVIKDHYMAIPVNYDMDY